MARRALVPGEFVAACPRRRQMHVADRLDQAAAMECGILLPHARYVVVSPVFVGRGARKLLMVALPGSRETIRVRPGMVRLWSNRKERKHRAGKNAG